LTVEVLEVYWKLNSSPLKHESVRLKVKRLITYYWAKAQMDRSLSEEKRLRLTKLQSKLDDVQNKSRGRFHKVIDRSGGAWGANRKFPTCVITLNSTLYKSKFIDDDMAAFSKYLSNLNSVREDEKLMSNSPITIAEIIHAIKCLKNKSPGNDETTAEIYKLFPELMTPFLSEVYSESIAQTALPTGMAKGNCPVTSINGIPVKEKINNLGIQTTKDPLDRIILHFNPMTDKAKNKFNIWLQRGPVFKKYVLLSKAEGISRLTYVVEKPSTE
ncbi:hypothetical protein Z043_115625, partial [Scleropages formosus]